MTCRRLVSLDTYSSSYSDLPIAVHFTYLRKVLGGVMTTDSIAGPPKFTGTAISLPDKNLSKIFEML